MQLPPRDRKRIKSIPEVRIQVLRFKYMNLERTALMCVEHTAGSPRISTERARVILPSEANYVAYAGPSECRWFEQDQ